MLTEASRSTIPPLIFICGLGRVCRLIILMRSTMARSREGMTRSTLPRLPPIFAGNHDNLVISADVKAVAHGYKTSGARDMIFMNFFSRSSRATGPKTRVPSGSPCSLISTAAFLSKRM